MTEGKSRFRAQDFAWLAWLLFVGILIAIRIAIYLCIDGPPTAIRRRAREFPVVKDGRG